MSASPPAAWYPDPSSPAIHRYWDGAAWTEQTRPATLTAPPASQTAIYQDQPKKKRGGSLVLKIVLGIVLAVVVLFVGCSVLVGSAIEDADNEAEKTAITPQEARSVAIGTPKADVVAQLGAPSSTQEDEFEGLGKSSCIYYNVAGEGFSLSSWQFCFNGKDRLRSRARY